jgi:hypothetical protein
MNKILSILFLFMFISSAAYAESKTIRRDIRDSKGKIIYRATTRGNVTETRDDSGKLLMRSKTTDGATEVRDASGRLIERIKNRR